MTIALLPSFQVRHGVCLASRVMVSGLHESFGRPGFNQTCGHKEQAMFRSLAFVALILTVASTTQADITQSPRLNGSVTVSLQWTTAEGKVKQKKFDELKLADIVRTGVWIAFEKKVGGVFPGAYYQGNFHTVDVPVNKMRSLKFYASARVNEKKYLRSTTIFNQQRPFGSRGVDVGNVYHLLVLDQAISQQDLPTSSAAIAVPQKQWRDSFWRTRRLAMNFAAQSDARTRKYEKVFDVKARYALPRLILASEEWVELQAKKKPSGGGSPLGRGIGILNSIGADPTPKNRRFPVYNIDVMLDWVSARGSYAAGFQTARSLWNDLLEGKVIYEATGGKRRVLTASIVFAQMEKNRTQRKATNRAVLVDAKSLDQLDRNKTLWSGTRKSITSFLKRNPTWKVLITEEPVTFYEKNKPIYALHAWYQVQPSSGRMIGMLPNGNHAGLSDEIARVARTGLPAPRQPAKRSRGVGGARGYFDQLAGMYVAAAGILEGVTLTFCNPAVAELSPADWKKFLAEHALDHAQQYLADHADLYDSYASQLAFWQGAMVMAGALGGEEAVKGVGRRALDGTRRSSSRDAEQFSNALKNNPGKSEVKEIKNEADERSRALGELLGGVEHTFNALRGG